MNQPPRFGIEQLRLVFFLVFLGIVIIANSIRVVREYDRLVVFRLGRLVGERGPGLVFLIPLVDRAVKVGNHDHEVVEGLQSHGADPGVGRATLMPRAAGERTGKKRSRSLSGTGAGDRTGTVPIKSMAPQCNCSGSGFGFNLVLTLTKA